MELFSSEVFDDGRQAYVQLGQLPNGTLDLDLTTWLELDQELEAVQAVQLWQWPSTPQSETHHQIDHGTSGDPASQTEEFVARALDMLSLSDVAKSKRLFLSFRALLARGSPREISALLQNIEAAYASDHVPHSSDPSTPVLEQEAPTRRRQRLTSLAGIEHAGLSGVSDECAIKFQEARAFFATQAANQAQLQRLLRVLRGVLQAPHQPAAFYQQLWTTHRGRIFETNDATQPRIARLFQGRKLIERESQRYEYAGRLSLLFLTHDLETTKSLQWKLTPGHSRQNAAVILIAAQLDIDPEEVKKEWRRSRNYVRLIQECGPAFLLELGVGVNWYWEKALNKQDVTLFIKYCTEQNPEIFSHAKQLNSVAGHMIIDGMIAYGWDPEAILRSDTRLRNALVLHCPEVFTEACSRPELLAQSREDEAPVGLSLDAS